MNTHDSFDKTISSVRPSNKPVRVCNRGEFSGSSVTERGLKVKVRRGPCGYPTTPYKCASGQNIYINIVPHNLPT